ncbi:MAG: NADH-ubiquinone oxidoreductase-F iron-sulfur binding region domain-containing protein [Bacillota bacterium]
MTWDLAELREEGLRSLYPGIPRIGVGTSTCGRAAGAGDVYQALVEAGQDRVQVKEVGCAGYCQVEPVVTVHVPGRARVVFHTVCPSMAPAMVSWALGSSGPLDPVAEMESDGLAPGAERRLGRGWGLSPLRDLDFYRGQNRLVMRNCGIIDPSSLPEYVAVGGFASLVMALGRPPEEILEEITASGLRGRGGAGFPTGYKWQATRSVPSEDRYVICNADEGDPGAYMDRGLLESDPFAVLEGLIIAAYVVGAHTTIIYVRAEYPLAVARLESAIESARMAGLTGPSILGTGFGVDIILVKGAGAYVCGEETALIASVEGRPGEPRPRPPFPAQKGLWGRPTVINNVETLANVPAVLAMGKDRFRSFGTEASPGTKVFSLVGDVRNAGLVEVEMGTPLEALMAMGGVDASSVKAVQTGGPSGGVIPGSMLDLPVDYEALARAGSIMGSGGLVVMGHTACMVDVARYFLGFAAQEACGKCTPCREGMARMRGVLDRLVEGSGRPGDLETLEEWALAVKDASLCGLGQNTPNPVLTTLRHFAGEYEAHLEGHCLAGVCRALIRYHIDTARCLACGVCQDECAAGAVLGEEERLIDPDRCIRCGSCKEVCPAEAISIGNGHR